MRDDAEILRRLRDAQISFVVIGGWAVIAHGHVRFTKNINVIVADTPAVRRAVTAVLVAAGATRLGGDRLAVDQAMPDQGWQVDTEHGRIDVLLEGAAPLDFASIEKAAITAEIDGVSIRVAGLEHLAALKRIAARPHDLDDLCALEELHGAPIRRLDLPGIDAA